MIIIWHNIQSGSNKKSWDSGSQSATNSFSALKDTTKRDVFWSVLSLNRTDGDKEEMVMEVR